MEYAGEHGFFNDRSWWAAWKASLDPPRPPYPTQLATASWMKNVEFLRKHLHLAEDGARL